MKCDEWLKVPIQIGEVFACFWGSFSCCLSLIWLIVVWRNQQPSLYTPQPNLLLTSALTILPIPPSGEFTLYAVGFYTIVFLFFVVMMAIAHVIIIRDEPYLKGNDSILRYPGKSVHHFFIVCAYEIFCLFWLDVLPLVLCFLFQYREPIQHGLNLLTKVCLVFWGRHH